MSEEWDALMAEKFPLIAAMGLKIYCVCDPSGHCPFTVYAYDLEAALESRKEESTPEDGEDVPK